jgi:hypothetical protein
MLGVAKTLVTNKEETSMRFYTKQHPYYCGIDLHTRTMYVCILDQAGETLLHRHMQATPEALLKAITPYRDQIVMAAECMFTWYWLADLCAEQGIPFVLGHALYMKAIHGGKAKNDTIDAHKIAVLLRGGMLPQAYVYPSEMRATRDLLRRRTHLARKRGELLAHVQNTNKIPTANTTCRRSAKRLPTKPIATASLNGLPIQRCKKALQSISHSSAATRRCSVTSSSPSSELPSTMTPIPYICCAQSPALARFSASCCSTKSMTSSASLGCKSSLRMVVW